MKPCANRSQFQSSTCPAERIKCSACRQCDRDNAPLFCDVADDVRMSARTAIEDAGGMVAGYYGGALQVALPADRDACNTLTESLRALGMAGDDTITWFPLGSDNPPESLRHFGMGTAACPRGDRPSYWKYRNYYYTA